jgi:hypothetical protein
MSSASNERSRWSSTSFIRRIGGSGTSAVEEDDDGAVDIETEEDIDDDDIDDDDAEDCVYNVPVNTVLSDSLTVSLGVEAIICWSF